VQFARASDEVINYQSHELSEKTGALDVERSQAYAPMNQLSDHELINWLCMVFEATCSNYYAQNL
jgi:hypothetical protein